MRAVRVIKILLSILPFTKSPVTVIKSIRKNGIKNIRRFINFFIETSILHKVKRITVLKLRKLAAFGKFFSSFEHSTARKYSFSPKEKTVKRKAEAVRIAIIP